MEVINVKNSSFLLKHNYLVLQSESDILTSYILSFTENVEVFSFRLIFYDSVILSHLSCDLKHYFLLTVKRLQQPIYVHVCFFYWRVVEIYKIII